MAVPLCYPTILWALKCTTAAGHVTLVPREDTVKGTVEAQLFPRMHQLCGCPRADEGAFLSSGWRRVSTFICSSRSSPAEWRERGRRGGGRGAQGVVSVERRRRRRRVGRTDRFTRVVMETLTCQNQEVTSSVLTVMEQKGQGQARPLTCHMFHTFDNKNSNVVKTWFIDMRSSEVGGARPPLARRLCCAGALDRPALPGPGPAGAALAAGGWGYCTGTGPEWEGQEGPGGVKARTFWGLCPAAPDRRPTGASTWSWWEICQTVTTETSTAG